MIDISIIIVSYNTKRLLANCLKSIFNTNSNLSIEVILVDNGSTDDSLDMVRLDYPAVRIIANQENLGFTHANNQGIRIANGNNILLLNSDTVLTPGALNTLLLDLHSIPELGLVGPRLVNGDGTVQPSVGEFIGLGLTFVFQFYLFKFLPVNFPLGDRIKPFQYKQYQHSHNVDWLSGACLLVRREVVDKAGMLDEDLFMYGEDMEWCWQIRQAGYKTRYCVDATVIHLSRQSSRKNYRRWISNYTFGNLRFIQRHRSRLSFRLCGLITTLGSILRILLSFIISILFYERKDECNQRISGYINALHMGWWVFTKGKMPLSNERGLMAN